MITNSKWICYYSEKADCSEESPCSFCAKRIKVDGVRTGPFTPEQEKEIQDWLDKNKDLMDDLVKSGD